MRLAIEASTDPAHLPMSRDRRAVAAAPRPVPRPRGPAADGSPHGYVERAPRCGCWARCMRSAGWTRSCAARAGDPQLGSALDDPAAGALSRVRRRPGVRSARVARPTRVPMVAAAVRRRCGPAGRVPVSGGAVRPAVRRSARRPLGRAPTLGPTSAPGRTGAHSPDRHRCRAAAGRRLRDLPPVTGRIWPTAAGAGRATATRSHPPRRDLWRVTRPATPPRRRAATAARLRFALRAWPGATADPVPAP